ncbi:hypothetical protein KSAC_22140 [Komagataeibacter saccharivorans]|nr:hypothetical protein KSAC_22140 [Komagataeibacter saccharivorans]
MRLKNPEPGATPFLASLSSMGMLLCNPLAMGSRAYCVCIAAATWGLTGDGNRHMQAMPVELPHEV